MKKEITQTIATLLSPSVDGRVFAVKVGIVVALCAIGIWLGGAGTWWARVGSWILLGGIFAHGVELQHQALHNTAFQSKRLNHFIGFLLGMPMLVSFTEYQTSHLRHHRLIGTPEDQESFDYDYQSLDDILGWLGHLLMVRHYAQKLRTLVNSALLGRSRQTNTRIRAEYRIMLFTILTGLGISITLRSLMILQCWLIPLFLVAAPLHVLIELPEHVGCRPDTTNVFRNTRSIQAGWFARWLTNGNNYHVEHHWHAGIQVESWGSLHQMLKHRVEFLEPSYWSFYRRFIHGLRAGVVNDPAYWQSRPSDSAATGPTPAELETVREG